MAKEKKAAPAAKPAAQEAMNQLRDTKKKLKVKNKGTSFIVNLVILVVLMTILAAVLMSMGMLNVFIFLMTGLAPGLVAFCMDSRAGRYASKTIIFLNLSGIMPQLVSIFASSNPNTTAGSFMNDPNIWLLIYGFAGFGWLMIRVIPQIVALYLTVKSDYEIKKLKHLQEKLLEEWGNKIKS